jgi:CheY-like chemotaxis protein
MMEPGNPMDSLEWRRSAMRRILVIDDDRSVRTIISMLLENLGYHVEVAEDGKEGIDAFHRLGNVDLVITDIRMPNMDGNEVARQIRKSDRPTIPLVAVTGYIEEVQIKAFDSALIKPFKLDELRNVIQSLISPGLTPAMETA